MKPVIHRFTLKVNDDVHKIPVGKVVMICKERSGIYNVPVAEVWVLRDLDSKATQNVRIIGTGQGLWGGEEHLGSWQDGSLVWHLVRLPGHLQ